MTRTLTRSSLFVAVMVTVAACGSGGTGTGGSGGTGGGTASGGGTGGATGGGTGGATGGGTGGATGGGTGGATGGGTGGATGGGTGGAAGGGTGGAAGGGTGGTGGAAGGGTGGAAGGGTGGAGGGTAFSDAGYALPDGGSISVMMSFFVTSKGTGTGGDLRLDSGVAADGLAGADLFCRQLAMAINPAFGAKNWKAYLSTSTVNARTRIGNGPWYNARGFVIATGVANLHDDAGTNALSQTASLDEQGNQVPSAGTVLHDIMTGSNVDGTVFTNAHCNNWTSNNGNNFIARVGHSNRAGGGMIPTSWNSAHASGGCGIPPGGNSVGSGGGRGSFYCFAAD